MALELCYCIRHRNVCKHLVHRRRWDFDQKFVSVEGCKAI